MSRVLFVTVLEPPEGVLVHQHGPALIADAGHECTHFAGVPIYRKILGAHNSGHVRRIPLLLTGRQNYLPRFLVPLIRPMIRPLLRSLEATRPDILHCRSYAAGLIGMWLKRRRPGLRVVFDPRGAYPFEGCALGRWSHGGADFRWWCRTEGEIAAAADCTIALGPAFAEYLGRESRPRNIHQMLPGTVENGFVAAREELREELGFTGRTVWAFAGSLYAWHTADRLVGLFRSIERMIPGSVLLIFSRSLKRRIREAVARSGFDADRVLIRSGTRTDVLRTLAACDFGLLPGGCPHEREIMSTFATKTAEYLASGLPVVFDSEIRGSGAFLREHGLGLGFSCRAGGVLEFESALEEFVSRREALAETSVEVHAEQLSRRTAAESLGGLYARLGSDRRGSV